MIYLDVKYFSEVCLSIYYDKYAVKTTLTTMRHFFCKKFKCLSVQHNLKLNCIKMPVFEPHFKIFNSYFLYTQHVVTRNKFTSFISFVYKFTTNSDFFSCKLVILFMCYVFPHGSRGFVFPLLP